MGFSERKCAAHTAVVRPAGACIYDRPFDESRVYQRDTPCGYTHRPCLAQTEAFVSPSKQHMPPALGYCTVCGSHTSMTSVISSVFSGVAARCSRRLGSALHRLGELRNAAKITFLSRGIIAAPANITDSRKTFCDAQSIGHRGRRIETEGELHALDGHR